MITHTSENFTLLLQDAIEGMKLMPDNSFDLCIADPPYGASTKANWNYDDSKKLNGFGGSWKLLSENWDLLSGNEIFQSSFLWLSELKRLVKPTGSIWIHATSYVCHRVFAMSYLNLDILNFRIKVKTLFHFFIMSILI